MRKLAVSHFRILVIYLLVVTVLRARIPGSIREFVDLVGLWVGGFLGVVLLDLDRIIHVYVERPQEQLSMQVQEFVRKRQFRDAVETLIARRREQQHLAFRNAVFAVVFLLVVFFSFTSAASLFGKGLAGGVMIHFLYDAWRDYLKDRERFSTWFLWMVQRDFSLREQQLVLYGITGVFAFFNLLLL